MEFIWVLILERKYVSLPLIRNDLSDRRTSLDLQETHWLTLWAMPILKDKMKCLKMHKIIVEAAPEKIAKKLKNLRRIVLLEYLYLEEFQIGNYNSSKRHVFQVLHSRLNCLQDITFLIMSFFELQDANSTSDFLNS